MPRNLKKSTEHATSLNINYAWQYNDYVIQLK